MRIHLLVAAAALALAAGCERGNDSAKPSASGSGSGSGSGSASGGSTAAQTTPANIGQPSSAEEKKEGVNPVQGQVDPKQSEQRQDFKQPGDGAGPTSPDTKPKN